MKHMKPITLSACETKTEKIKKKRKKEEKKLV